MAKGRTSTKEIWPKAVRPLAIPLLASIAQGLNLTHGQSLTSFARSLHSLARSHSGSLSDSHAIAFRQLDRAHILPIWFVALDELDALAELVEPK